MPDPQPVSQAAYTLNASGNCPNCDSENVSGQGVDIQIPIARQDMHCFACGADWMDRYVLAGYDDLVVPDPEEP